MSTPPMGPSPRHQQRHPPVFRMLGSFVLVLLTGCATPSPGARGLGSTSTALRPPDHYVEPTYQQEPSTGQWRWLDPLRVEQWLRDGLTSNLWGSLVPDIVLHASGNPNQLQHIYDFKFPCPAKNRPQWRSYARGQPHYPKTQGEMYRDALLGPTFRRSLT
jgi:hypothetical protein